MFGVTTSMGMLKGLLHATSAKYRLCNIPSERRFRTRGETL